MTANNCFQKWQSTPCLDNGVFFLCGGLNQFPDIDFLKRLIAERNSSAQRHCIQRSIETMK